jgi:hypothetical protein
MSQSRFLRIAILLVTPVAFYLLSTGAAHAQMKCQINPNTQCQGCVGRVGGLCCFSYSCADGSGGTSCTRCLQAKVHVVKSDVLISGITIQNEGVRDQQDKVILPTELLAKNDELESAIQSLR